MAERYPYRQLGSSWDSTFRNNQNANLQDIENDIKDLRTDVNTKDSATNQRVTDHQNSTTAHAAQNVTYTGSVPATNVKAAIDDIDDRIDNIVADAGSSNAEIVDARHDSVNNETHPTLKDRLDSDSNKIGILSEAKSLLHFEAKGDGVTNDTSALTNAENSNYEVIDLVGKVYVVDNLPSKKIYKNGYFKVGEVIYPTKDVFFDVEKKQITSNRLYSAWCQDKCFYHNGKLTVVFNEGSGHPSSDLKPVKIVSYDKGKTFIEEYLQNGDTSYSGGVSCWGAGTEGIREYYVMFYRGVDRLIGNSKHVLKYRALGNTNYVEQEINFNDGTNVPIAFHSFGHLAATNEILFGYHYDSGEVGIAKSNDLGVTWTKSVIYTSAEMGNTVMLVEPTILVDNENGVVLGILRTQDPNIQKTKLFISRDNLATFETYDFPISIKYSIGSIKKVGNQYVTILQERLDEGKTYYCSGDVTDVLNNGASAFKVYSIGNIACVPTSLGIATGAGVGSLVVIDGNLNYFYSEEITAHEPNIFHLSINNNITKNGLMDIRKSFVTTPKRLTTEEDTAYANCSNNVATSISASTEHVLKFNFINEPSQKYGAAFNIDQNTGAITILEDGWYNFDLMVGIGSVASAPFAMQIDLFIGGVLKKRLNHTENSSGTSGYINASYLAKLSRNSVVELRFVCNKSCSLLADATKNYLTIYQLK